MKNGIAERRGYVSKGLPALGLLLANGLLWWGVTAFAQGGGVPTVQFSSTSYIDNNQPIYIVNQNATSVTVTVTLSAASSQPVSVAYNTYNGVGESRLPAAIAGINYVAAAGALVFPAGTVSQNITIQLIPGSLTQPYGLFSVLLSDAVNAQLAPAGSGAIINITSAPVSPPPTVQFASSSYPVNENAGTAVLTVTLSSSSASAVIVNYATSDGTAVAGTDYTATSETITFAPGVTSQTINIGIIDNDNYTNQTVSFAVALSQPSANATLATPPTTTVRISDNDPAPVATITIPGVPNNQKNNPGGYVCVNANNDNGSTLCYPNPANFNLPDITQPVPQAPTVFR